MEEEMLPDVHEEGLALSGQGQERKGNPSRHQCEAWPGWWEMSLEKQAEHRPARAVQTNLRRLRRGRVVRPGDAFERDQPEAMRRPCPHVAADTEFRGRSRRDECAPGGRWPR